jgi:shikimate dehydrogenase
VPPKSPRYAVIGDPVAHSRSPRIFSFLFEQTGLPGTYEALRVAPEGLPAVIERVRAGELQGLSVTLPHKQAVLPLLDEIHATAQRVAAVNCVWLGSDMRVHGFNTDLIGCQRAIEEQGRRLNGARMVLLGAGGAARSAAFLAKSGGVRSLVIANRSVARAQALADELGGISVRALGLESPELQDALDNADLLVNSTSVGLADPSANPLPAGTRLSSGMVVMDMVYEPTETALLAQARAAGAVCIDGLWMLVHQALEQLRLWTGYTSGPAFAGLLYRHISKEIA